jgi:predicted amidohydrolase
MRTFSGLASPSQRLPPMAPNWPFFRRCFTATTSHYDTAMLINPSAEIAGKYLKVHPAAA